MDGGLRHLFVRKRIAQESPHLVCEPYPARTPTLRLLDHAMIFIAMLSPIMLLPQALQVFVTKDASSLSIYTWSGLTVLNLLWATYGFVHKDKPILIASASVALIDLVIVIGIVSYS